MMEDAPTMADAPTKSGFVVEHAPSSIENTTTV